VIAREKQRKQLGGGTISDGETRAKNASGNGSLGFVLLRAIVRFSGKKPQVDHFFCRDGKMHV
jgi:hypothetical protein